MITALDHIVLACPDIDEAVAGYEKLFGLKRAWRSHADGAATALFRLENTALELMAPAGDGPVGERLTEVLAGEGLGLKSIAFETNDIDEARHTLGRLGLDPSDVSHGSGHDPDSGHHREWRRFKLSPDTTYGPRIFVLQHLKGRLDSGPSEPGAVRALDHVVIATPNPDRAIALYGARLGLRFALDRTAEQWNTRFMFFRVGGLTFEVIHRLDQADDPNAADKIWGVTWKVDDADAARERLSADAFDVSEVRPGRKPGTRVFTVRDGTLSVPTLFLEQSPR